MKRKEILEKAIQKAIDSGFRLPFKHWEVSDKLYIKGFNKSIQDGYSIADTNTILFDHSFARALWGEWVDDTIGHTSETYRPSRAGRGWQYHLQQMVTADDPIQYLGDHLDD